MRYLSIGCCLLTTLLISSTASAETVDEVQHRIDSFTRQIASNPADASIFTRRGDAYFKIHEFDKAISDYSAALKIDKHYDDALYGRGLALSRNGKVEAGIQDLTIFINRNPKSSRGYTKRGVRYMWIGSMDEAYADLSRAIELDNRNAEAHDDIGVILSQRKQYDLAIQHFRKTLAVDPTYQKAHHNIAIAYYLTSRNQRALEAVNRSLLLNPNNRSSVILKAVILNDLGRVNEARKLRDQADMMSQGNWSENMEIR